MLHPFKLCHSLCSGIHTSPLLRTAFWPNQLEHFLDLLVEHSVFKSAPPPSLPSTPPPRAFTAGKNQNRGLNTVIDQCIKDRIAGGENSPDPLPSPSVRRWYCLEQLCFLISLPFPWIPARQALLFHEIYVAHTFQQSSPLVGLCSEITDCTGNRVSQPQSKEKIASFG